MPPTSIPKALPPSPSPGIERAATLGVYPIILLIINLLIVARLFRVAYTPYLESNEGTFVAIAQKVAEHPSHFILDRGWWPWWDLGFPFDFTYLPGLQIMVGLYSRWTGIPAGLAFHQVCAFFYAVMPLGVYAMAWVMTKRAFPSFAAALIVSLVSPCAWLVPAIARDIGGPWNLRRLQVLAYYGEGPHTAALVFLPLAILFLYLSLIKPRYWTFVLAGMFAGLTVIMNAFGATILILATLSLLATIQTHRILRNAALLAAIGALSYVWISPWLPPSVLLSIEKNSQIVGGDYRFSRWTVLTWAILAAGFGIVWIATRAWPPAVRFFALFAELASGIVLLAYAFNLFAVPQPHRYQNVMDIALCLTMTFGAGLLFDRLSPRITRAAVAILLLLAAIQLVHQIGYAHSVIRRGDPTQSESYRVAKWADQHLEGQRIFVAGQWAYHFNVFTDTPQMAGGHEPMQPNYMMLVAPFTIYTGTNAGARDAAISILWLQAMGTHAIAVPGPNGSEYYKPFTNPRKFEGVLPVLWREGDDTIYEVPSRSQSLAHVVPRESIIQHTPIHGLDVDELERYVAAINQTGSQPDLPDATFRWTSLNDAEINAKVAPGQSLSVQVSYDSGWKATANGVPVKVEKDGIGMLYLRPQCEQGCRIVLDYAGNWEQFITGWSSVLLIGVIAIAGVWRRVRHLQHVRE